MKNLPLPLKIVIGMVAGIVWAFASSAMGWNQFTIDWIDPFGTIFIRLLKMIAVPLVLFSIISGVMSLTDVSRLRRLGIKTITAYMLTTFFAIGLGLGLVNFFQPGNAMDYDQRVKNRVSYEKWLIDEKIGDTPDGISYLTDPKYKNFVNDSTYALQQSVNSKVADKLESAQKQKDGSPLKFLVDMVPDNVILSLSSNGLMLQVIFFALFFGLTMVLMPEEKVSTLKSLIENISEVFLKMVDYVMKASPYFVFALMSGVIAKMADSPAEVLEIFIGLGTYTILVLVGLWTLIFIVYPLIIKIFVSKLSYREYFKNISPAQFLAFSTSSSAATLPATIECVEDNMGVPKSISRFVLPIGATINMDGTSLHQTISVLFLAQLHLIDLSMAQQITIVLTVALSSIGTAAVPSAGLVMMMIVLQSVGLNPAWVAIVIPVDRILDMWRTVVNVTGDATISTIVAKSEGDLKKYE